LIRNLRQLKTAVFQHWCLICGLPLVFKFEKTKIKLSKKEFKICGD
jgi:hypothetical protein